MKRSTRLGLSSLAVAGLVAGAVLGIAQLASAATNLVTNPGFESGLTGWSCSAGKTVSAPVHSGAAALEGAASNSDTAQCTQDVAVVSGQQYTLSAWVQGNYVYLGVTGGASTWTPGSSGYSQLSLTFTASSSTAQIYLHGWYAQGSYHADDVVLAGPGGTVNAADTDRAARHRYHLDQRLAGLDRLDRGHRLHGVPGHERHHRHRYQRDDRRAVRRYHLFLRGQRDQRQR